MVEYITNLVLNYLLTYSVALVRKRTIPTERPPLVAEVSAKEENSEQKCQWFKAMSLLQSTVSVSADGHVPVQKALGDINTSCTFSLSNLRDHSSVETCLEHSTSLSSQQLL
jgi:hypothetical protein